MLISFMAIELVSVLSSCDIVTNGNRVNARLLVGIFVKLCIKFTFKLAGLEDRIPVVTKVLDCGLNARNAAKPPA